MNIPYEKWHEALLVRRSRRQYLPRGLNEPVVQYLQKFSTPLNGFLAGCRVVLVTEEPDNVFKGIIGSYGKIKGAPAYAAFIGDTQHPNVEENIGYLGEAFILEATSMGLGTCWVGGFFDAKVVKNQIKIALNEKVFAVTPVGYAAAEYKIEEKLMSNIVSSHKRKQLDVLCSGLREEKWPKWIKQGLNAARLAPSAVNRQPWRFLVGEDSVTVSVDSTFLQLGVPKRLDCGIAMLHFEIGAMNAGIHGKWQHLPSPQVSRFYPECD